MKQHSSLWLPPGSVRALLAFGLIGGVIVGAFLDMAEGKFTALVGLAGAAIGYYFGSKSATKANE